MARNRPDSYGPRPSVAESRPVLLIAALDFVRDARTCPNVLRIALVGSLATAKPNPKDIDVLVTLADDDELAPLAMASRRLKGRANVINLSADVFLCDAQGDYLGRVCLFRNCHPRSACDGWQCRPGRYLNNDLHEITLDRSLALAPPIDLWPSVQCRVTPPDDVERLLLAPLSQEAATVRGALPGAE